MRLLPGLVLAATSIAALAAAAAPADAACKKMGFVVNDYGKDGPTKDAQSLLEKDIAKWAAGQGIATYTVSNRDVKCELFLDVILFDEHTCTASASVCWDEKNPNAKPSETTAAGAAKTATVKTANKKPAKPAAEKTADGQPTKLEAKDARAEAKSDKPDLAASTEKPAQPAKAPEATGALPDTKPDGKSDTMPEGKPQTKTETNAATSPAPAAAAPVMPAVTPADDAAKSAAAAAERAAQAAERAAAAAERAATAAASMSPAPPAPSTPAVPAVPAHDTASSTAADVVKDAMIEPIMPAPAP